MDNYLPNKNALYEARIARWIAIRRITLKPRLHEKILFDKFIMTNAFDQKLAC